MPVCRLHFRYMLLCAAAMLALKATPRRFSPQPEHASRYKAISQVGTGIWKRLCGKKTSWTGKCSLREGRKSGIGMEDGWKGMRLTNRHMPSHPKTVLLYLFYPCHLWFLIHEQKGMKNNLSSTLKAIHRLHLLSITTTMNVTYFACIEFTALR